MTKSLSVKLNEGKAAFVKWAHPTKGIIDVCLCLWNVDFSTRGCISLVRGDKLLEVFQNTGNYAPGNFQLYRKEGIADNRCFICYAKRFNKGCVDCRAVDERTEREFIEKKPSIIRLGKLTEAGHPFYTEALMKFLELCKKYKAQLIFPTKMLPFGSEGLTKEIRENLPQEIIETLPSGREISERLRETKSVVNYSISNDRFEPGAVSQGFTNEWRIEQARKYAEAGVQVTLTIICDVTVSLEENIRLGYTVQSALDAESRLKTRLLPLRIPPGWAQEITGFPRDAILDVTLDNQQEFPFELGRGRFSRRKNNELYPRTCHPDFSHFIGEIRVCGRTGETEYCDKCCLPGYEDAKLKFPASQIVNVVYTKKDKRRKPKVNRDDNGFFG